MTIVSEKINWVQKVLNDWELTAEEQCLFAGVTSGNQPFKSAIAFKDDAEKRCDLIFEIKVGVEHLFSDDNDMQKKWFRAKLESFGGLSPLEFLRVNPKERLAAFEPIIRGPA